MDFDLAEEVDDADAGEHKEKKDNSTPSGPLRFKTATLMVVQYLYLCHWQCKELYTFMYGL